VIDSKGEPELPPSEKAGFFSRFVRGRNVWLFGDQAVTALGSVAILLFAARAFPPSQLAAFSLAQLVATTLQAIMRAAVLNPSLASQRTHGVGAIPLRWAITAGPVVGLLAVAGALIANSGSKVPPGPDWYVAVPAAAVTLVLMDLARYRCFSGGAFQRVLIGDLVWIALIVGVATATVVFGFSSPSALMSAWAVANLGGLGVMAFHRSAASGRSIRFRETWVLGRWGGLESLMSSAANLLPMFVTTLALGSDSAGFYRVLQSALGPLNIVNTSVSIAFGLDSWRLNGETALRELRAKVLRITALLVTFAVLYIALAEVAVIFVSGLTGDDLFRVALIVGIAGVLGAATTASSAAALALGYQRFGVLIRSGTVLLAVGVSVAAAAGYWVPWGDPIGTVSLAAAAIGLAGWSFTFAAGLRHEVKKTLVPPGSLSE